MILSKSLNLSKISIFDFFFNFKITDYFINININSIIFKNEKK